MINGGRTAACVLSKLLLVTSSAFCAEPSWGNLKMRFQYEGKPPVLREFPILKDEAVCAKEKVFDESLLVNAKNGGLANVIVWMAVEKEQKLPEEHAEHVAAAKKEIKLDAVKCRFEPRVSIVRTNQTLRVGNSDPISHNPNIGIIENTKPFGRAIPTGPSHVEVFKIPERIPVSVACNVHPWMSGRILIQDHPYMAVSNADGNLEVLHVPAGKWTFIAWHERIGWLGKVTVNDRVRQWKNGRFDVEINREEVDLGKLKLSPEFFKK